MSRISSYWDFIGYTGSFTVVKGNYYSQIDTKNALELDFLGETFLAVSNYSLCLFAILASCKIAHRLYGFTQMFLILLFEIRVIRGKKNLGIIAVKHKY